MVTIKAHFDGRVFVPDEPVRFRSGEQVVIEQLGEVPSKAVPEPDVSFMCKLNIDLDARSLREIVDDPELRTENS